LKKLYRVGALSEVASNFKPMIQLVLYPVDLTLEHQAPPSQLTQLKMQLDKAGIPEDFKKVIMEMTSSLVPPGAIQIATYPSDLVITKEEYEKMDRPTVGQHISVDVEIREVDAPVDKSQ